MWLGNDLRATSCSESQLLQLLSSDGLSGRGQPPADFPPSQPSPTVLWFWYLLSWGAVKRRSSWVVKIPDLLLEVFMMAMLSHFPPSACERTRESGNTLSLSCLCVWVQCFGEGGRGRERSKLKERNSALSFTKAPLLSFVSDGRLVLDFIKSKI